VLLGYGDETFQSQKNYTIGSSPSSVISYNFNNDTKLDLVVTITTLVAVSVYYLAKEMQPSRLKQT
jgi:hypothetical protein